MNCPLARASRMLMPEFYFSLNSRLDSFLDFKIKTFFQTQKDLLVPGHSFVAPFTKITATAWFTHRFCTQCAAYSSSYLYECSLFYRTNIFLPYYNYNYITHTLTHTKLIIDLFLLQVNISNYTSMPGEFSFKKSVSKFQKFEMPTSFKKVTQLKQFSKFHAVNQSLLMFVLFKVDTHINEQVTYLLQRITSNSHNLYLSQQYNAKSLILSLPQRYNKE